MTPRGADTTGSAAALVDRIRTRAGWARGSTRLGAAQVRADGLLGAKPRPRPTRARRRHALIGSARGRGGRRRARAARRHQR
jgi:hypothetical protein